MSRPARDRGPGAVRFTATRGERCRFRIDVEVPSEYFAAVRDRVVAEFMGRVRLKGFRKGRIPAGVVMRQYGREIFDETCKRVASEASEEAIAAEGLTPVSQVHLNDLNAGEDEATALTFNATFEALPEIPLERLGGFQVEQPAAEVPAGALDELVDDIRRRNATWRTVEEGKPVDGDSVSVRVAALTEDDGANSEVREYDLLLGEDQALPGIERAIRTLEPGEAGEFDVAFPDDHPDPERAGTRHRLLIELASRRVAALPPLDDDFARTVSDADDLESLRAFLGAKLAHEAEARAEQELRRRLVDLVVEANPFDVPDALVDERLDRIFADNSRELEPGAEEKLRKGLRPAAEHALRQDLLIERILDEHELRAPKSKVEEVVRAIAERAGESPSAMRAQMKRSGDLERIWSRITDDRLFGFLKEKSRITQAAPAATEGPPTGIHPTGD